jgi:uncharacterized lipoprotein YmbA
MTGAFRFRLVLAFGIALAAAACSSPNPDLYTIAPVPGSELNGGPKVVALRGVGVARYLQRNQIVRSSEDYRVDLKANDWWGEPLDAMMARVLIEDLSQRLPGSTIYTSAGAVTESPQATVEIEIRRLDLDKSGNLILVAEASVSLKDSKSPDTRRIRLSTVPPMPSVSGQIAATSSAVAQLADRIAEMLVTAHVRK